MEFLVGTTETRWTALYLCPDVIPGRDSRNAQKIRRNLSFEKGQAGATQDRAVLALLLFDHEIRSSPTKVVI